ncbi:MULTISPECIES: 3-hydroxyacyl-CoA dehydrogenase family protein [unclassified Streptomyces]|uniref:3-hydroxyacyl-CoA dehydrogenase family protein n=1 Tax=unclassified Streptomyces TaxID=2593676 RepID=UPI0029BFC477|nr:MULTISPECIES: 3-hydroxyacyl-CoA dehydrogenase family protein [unclassified Streptomyces]
MARVPRDRKSLRSPRRRQSRHLTDECAGHTATRTAAQLYAEYKEPLYAAPPLLQRMVDAGRLGSKTGSGFYPYE